MLNLEDYGTIFILVSLVGVLVFASPALVFVFPSRAGERFSELYVLGPNRMAEGYPSNVVDNETYKVFLGIGNHMGSSAYYILYVKLRNQTEPLPNSTAGTPSSLPALYEYHVFLGDGRVWETPLSFSLRGFSFYGNSCNVETLNIDGLDLHIDKLVSWDSENVGYYLELFFELWVYDSGSEGVSFHNRFVGIWLNMTG